jgi:hypothetical protein
VQPITKSKKRTVVVAKNNEIEKLGNQTKALHFYASPEKVESMVGCKESLCYLTNCNSCMEFEK